MVPTHLFKQSRILVGILALLAGSWSISTDDLSSNKWNLIGTLLSCLEKLCLTTNASISVSKKWQWWCHSEMCNSYESSECCSSLILHVILSQLPMDYAFYTQLMHTTTLVHSTDLILHSHEFQLKIFALNDFRSLVSTASLLNFVQCFSWYVVRLKESGQSMIFIKWWRFSWTSSSLRRAYVFFNVPQFQQIQRILINFLYNPS